MKPLHHKKHTLAKRFLSLLCVLALCLGLLPVTALAAEGAPGRLYVGNQQVIVAETVTYWSTNDSGALERVVGANDTSNNWNVKYDPSTATLTLNEAKISGSFDKFSNPFTAGIYAKGSSNKAVALTIELIGTNTITGAYGIYVDAQQGEPVGTNASLLIKNGNESGESGSLTVNGTSSYGIYILSGTGDASLTIENASVDAETTQTTYSGYAGVCVQSGMNATSSPQLSLSVDGGSLTTSASEGNDGIQFYVGSSVATDATTSLTVSENAIVDARTGGISASGVSGNPNVTIGSNDNTGGIVWNGTEGTVYGNVTLDESLTINQGETLTIGKDASLTVPSGTTLTNNGTVTTTEGGILTNNGTINNSGTLPDTISGNQPPKITTERLNDGTVNTKYNQTLVASGDDTITWSVSGALPAGLTLDSSTGTITGTPTAAGASTFTVTATNDSGSDSKAFTLTVTQPVTSVTLDKNTLELYTGDTASLIATVQPDNATNKNVTWSSDKPEVATVENGKVTAKAAGTATITVTTEDGEKTATCTVTVTDKTYAISADATVLNFGSAYTGYTQPAAQTVTVKNTGNQTVTLNQPASTSSFEVGTLSKTELAAGEKATFTVQPKAGLAVGTYNETIEVTGTEGAAVTIPASFTVKSRPSYNPPTVSEETTEAIADAQPGETVTVDLSHGSTKLDKEVFETLAGKDVTLVIDLGDGLSWTVNGSDIPEDATLTDIDMGVTMNSDGIPVDVVNTITGERDTVQMTLAHDGEFGFTMTLTAPLGKENAGYWANLYHFDEKAQALNFEAAAKIDEDGSVTIPFSHASQYAIVIDTHSHATVDVSDIFVDVAPDAWYKDAVQYAYDNGLMTGVSATEFAPEATTTRAMIVSILARLEGVTTAEAAGFADVDDNDWYATAVNWAANVGVVNGYEDNTFKPNTAITREQLATILMNYAAYKGEDVSNRADLTSYTDQPSTWAQEAMQWAVAEGLISGVTNDQLQPQGNATRAQVAAILQRFLEA